MEQDTTCPYCNERPLGKRKNARTCGDKACQRARNYETFSREKDREHKRKVRAADPDLGKDWMTCPECGDMFLGYPNQVRCSIACANKSRAGDPAEVAKRRAERQRERRARQEKLRGQSCPVVFQRCPMCDVVYSSDPRVGKVYCSTRCSRKAKDVRDRPWRYRAERIFERDHYTCWICGEATSQGWNEGDYLSPSIDHVVPRSHGGDDHEGNLRTSHWICNTIRGDRDWMTPEQIAIGVRRAMERRERRRLSLAA